MMTNVDNRQFKLNSYVPFRIIIYCEPVIIVGNQFSEKHGLQSEAFPIHNMHSTVGESNTKISLNAPPTFFVNGFCWHAWLDEPLLNNFQNNLQ
jgi:hypothetical protein